MVLILSCFLNICVLYCAGIIACQPSPSSEGNKQDGDPATVFTRSFIRDMVERLDVNHDGKLSIEGK